MVPDKFNMVDMGGIDLIMMQGEAVPGLYDKLMAAVSNCRYQCLYNWLFDGVLIPPAYVQIEVDDDEVHLNEGVSVTSDDVIRIYTIEPEIIPLLAEENGVYNVPAGKAGFNPVTVNVPTPVINPISITENGTYTASAGVDGYSPITVNVPSEESNLALMLDWEQGTSSWTTGRTYWNNKAASNARIRTVAMIPLTVNENYRIKVSAAFEVCIIQYWGSTCMYADPQPSFCTTWFSGELAFTPSSQYIGLVIRKVNGNDITPSELEQTGIVLTKVIT